MKVFLILAVTIAVAASVPIAPSYLQSLVGVGGLGQRSSFGIIPQPNQYVQQRVAPALAAHPDQQIAILRSESDQGPDGSYRWAYETANGIAAEEQGQQKQIGAEAGTVAQGSYQYTAPDGQVISVQYIADENGFQPQGNVLPTPPPVPEAILKSLAWNAAHPEEDNLH